MGQRFGLEKQKHEFPHCQYMQFPKKVKKDFVMNVEITDNSKEVSGAIHQVGQAIADTGSLLQSLQQGHWHGTVAVLYPGRSCGPCGLSANGKVWRSQSRIQRSQRIHTAAQAAQGMRSQAVTGDTAKAD